MKRTSKPQSAWRSCRVCDALIVGSVDLCAACFAEREMQNDMHAVGRVRWVLVLLLVAAAVLVYAISRFM